MCLRRPSLSTLPMRFWPVSAVVDRSTLSTLGCFRIPAPLFISQAGILAVKPEPGCMPSPISGKCSKPPCWLVCYAQSPAIARRPCGDWQSVGSASCCRAVPSCHMHCSGACQGLLWRCSGLRVLHITGAERLQEDALGMLAPLAATLRELSLCGCSLLRDRAGHHLQALTQLTSLDIGGEEICQYHARQCISARHDVNAILYKSRSCICCMVCVAWQLHVRQRQLWRCRDKDTIRKHHGSAQPRCAVCTGGRDQWS